MVDEVSWHWDVLNSESNHCHLAHDPCSMGNQHNSAFNILSLRLSLALDHLKN